MSKLYVTPDQFSEIKKLELSCTTPVWNFEKNEFVDYFNDVKWVKGLKEICGEEAIDNLETCGKVEVVVE